MSKPIIVIHDLADGSIIEREMTDSEFEQWQIGNKAKSDADAVLMAKKIEAEKKLTAIGLTVDDLKALGL